MRSVPGANRGPRAGNPRGVVIATGSREQYRGREVSAGSEPGSPRGQPAWGGGNDRVQLTHDRGSRSRYPVAIAPGTDSRSSSRRQCGRDVLRSVQGEAESRCIGIGLRAAGQQKGNFWLDSALENREPDAVSGFSPPSSLPCIRLTSLSFGL
jgi:hypothetical protein